MQVPATESRITPDKEPRAPLPCRNVVFLMVSTEAHNRVMQSRVQCFSRAMQFT